jgi:ribosomal-protein-alanine N-acetyltransferase
MNAVEAIAAGPVVLRPWQPGDAAALVRHADDAEVSRWLRDRFPWPYRAADAEAFLAIANDPGDEWRLAIAHDGEAIGGIGMRVGADVHRHSAELGYWLGQAHWRRGYMRAAVSAFVPVAMTRLRLHRVCARVFDGNTASMRLLERCGFEKEGRLRREVMKRGTLLDTVIYAKTRQTLDETP